MTASANASSSQDLNIGDMVLLFVPGETYRALSDAAKARNMTVAQLMANALDEYIKSTSDKKLLTEIK